MSYTAAAVANEFLDHAQQTRFPLTQIVIQKLVYFAQGWSLAITGKRLVDEDALAWKYGPVYRSLYDEFRYCGSEPIEKKAEEWDFDGEGNFIREVAIINSGKQAEDKFARDVVSFVWQKYGTLPPFKLVELTHIQNGPWDRARVHGERAIDTDVIREHFEKEAANVTA